MKHKFKKEFLSICKEIFKKDLNIGQWALIESSDEFQNDKYCGGFDATENEFTFSYYNENDEEFWFQLSLNNIKDVIEGKITEIETKRAE